ncbi:MAG TPA: hypothetical protein P5136_01370 [Methanofastidiosum sp.]|nr:hypothetical protein [Methanofastidiosum sp.]
MITVTDSHRGKMKGLWSINTSTMSNPFCQKMQKTNAICSKCYAQRIEHTYGRKQPIGIWKENGKILSSRILKDKEIRIFKKDVPIRFHSFGELLNLTHLLNFFKIATMNPDRIFALWSKRSDLVRKVYKDKPANLILIYSTPQINKLKPKKLQGFDKVFSVYTEEFAKEHKIKINCHASCINCMTCYSHSQTVYVNELVKKGT